MTSTACSLADGSLARVILFTREKSLLTLAYFPCAGVGMLTPQSDWSSHMIAR